jgi:hypothetical protein
MSWTKIQGEELQRLRNRLELSPPQSSALGASTLRTPFYSNGALVKINDGVDNVFMVAAGPGEISAREYYPLNGRSVDIYAANMAASLSIAQDNAGDYLQLFFTTFVRDGDGEPSLSRHGDSDALFGEEVHSLLRGKLSANSRAARGVDRYTPCDKDGTGDRRCGRSIAQ